MRHIPRDPPPALPPPKREELPLVERILCGVFVVGAVLWLAWVLTQ